MSRTMVQESAGGKTQVSRDFKKLSLVFSPIIPSIHVKEYTLTSKHQKRFKAGIWNLFLVCLKFKNNPRIIIQHLATQLI